MKRSVENARSLRIGPCIDPQCRCVHIQFIDHDGELFAQASLPVAEIPSTLDDLKNCAYQIVTGGKE